MKKTMLVSLSLVFSHAAFAVNPRIVSYSTTFYPGAGINFYSYQSEEFLLEAASEFCTQHNRQVDGISNVNIQIQADFQLYKGDLGVGKTKATSYPKVIFTALVACKSKALIDQNK